MSTKENNISQITDYLKGKLDARAMYKLERNAQDDPFLMDAVEGFETIGQDQGANLLELQTRLAERVADKKDRSILLWRILPIAACLLIAIGGYWLFVPQSKQTLVDNIVRIKHQTPKIENAKKPSGANSFKKSADGNDHLTKNIASHILSSPKTKNKPADTIASKNNLLAIREGKAFPGSDVKPALKNIPAEAHEKARIKDEYAFNSSLAYQNRKAIGNFGNAHLRHSKDTGAAKYLNTDLLSANTHKNGSYGAVSTPEKDLTEPVIRGYVKRHDDKIIGQQTYIITGKEVQDNPVGTVEQLLQGRTAKLNIQTNMVAISGRITDTAGKPLAGVLVGNPHSNIIATDANGRYRALINKDSALVVSHLGYESQNLQIKPGQSTLDIKLKEGSQALAEINIWGYVKRTRDQTTGASYIITGKDGACKENLRFKKRFFAKIAIAERYVAEHAKGDSVFTIRDGKFLRALKFIAKRAPTTLETNKTVYGYADLKVFAQNKERWLHWYELNKCKHLK